MCLAFLFVSTSCNSFFPVFLVLIFICLFIDFILLPFYIVFVFLIGTYFRQNNPINYSASRVCYLNPSRNRSIVQVIKWHENDVCLCRELSQPRISAFFKNMHWFLVYVRPLLFCHFWSSSRVVQARTQFTTVCSVVNLGGSTLHMKCRRR
jgi:hypothetical protein